MILNKLRFAFLKIVCSYFRAILSVQFLLLGIVKLIKAMPMPDTTMPQVLSADGTLKDQVSMSSCLVFLACFALLHSKEDPVICPCSVCSHSYVVFTFTLCLIYQQVEETPGLWVLEKNWRHRLENASIAAEKLESEFICAHHLIVPFPLFSIHI